MKTRGVIYILLAATLLSCETGTASQRLSQMRDFSTLEGVWQDTKWGDLLTLEVLSGNLTAKAVIDGKTTEEFLVQHSSFAETGLTFQYKINSNDTTVVATIDSLQADSLTGAWRLEDNTNSGTFTYKKILDRLPEDPKQKSAEVVAKPIAKIFRLRDDGIVITSPHMSRIRMGENLYVSVGGRRIYIKVTFPMITIARCKADKNSTGLLAEGMPVFRE